MVIAMPDLNRWFFFFESGKMQLVVRMRTPARSRIEACRLVVVQFAYRRFMPHARPTMVDASKKAWWFELASWGRRR
jgi:hypothetical protein